MAIVVSDTSPVRALAHLNLLALLPQLFSDVIIPPAVVRELARRRKRFKPVAAEEIHFARVLTPTDSAAVERLRQRVDAGEAEAIVLAIEVHADRILIDEATARAVARNHGLRVLGVLGVLVRAKRLGLVPEVRPLIDRLEQELGFFLSHEVRNRALKQARET